MIKKQNGFTLIETIMVMAIVAILAGIIAPLLGTATEAIGLRIARVDLEESSVVALSRMSREVRRIRDNASIVTASNTQFEFIDKNSIQIRYRLTGNTLMRSENGTESGLADNVSAGTLSFNYYDDAGVVLAAPLAGAGVQTDVRRIRIQMTFQNGANSLPVEIQVRPKNVRHETYLFG